MDNGLMVFCEGGATLDRARESIRYYVRHYGERPALMLVNASRDLPQNIDGIPVRTSDSIANDHVWLGGE